MVEGVSFDSYAGMASYCSVRGLEANKPNSMWMTHLSREQYYFRSH